MQTYLKIEVRLNRDAHWYMALRRKLKTAGINVNWQLGNFHITIAFMNDDAHKEQLKTIFGNIIRQHPAPQLTFNKLDAFTSKNSRQHIVNLTSTCASEEFTALVNQLRTAAIKVGANPEDYRLHVTLGRVEGDAANLETILRILSAIEIKPFTLTLNKAKYKYFRGDDIASWDFGVAH